MAQQLKLRDKSRFLERRIEDKSVGYDLHVTRARSWALNTKHQILAEEWLAYVEKDPELSLSREGGGKSKLNEL